MAILNQNPSPKEIVILQRNDSNTLYGEVHISGSKRIIHIDSSGYLNVDDSASFYTLYPPPVSSGGLTPGATYPITSSWSISASWAPSTPQARLSLRGSSLYLQVIP
jgi:hypothetical protein